MEIWDLITKIRDALKDQEDITTWCQANFEQDHHVYICYDERNPPPEDHYPILVISATEQERSLRVDYGSMTVEIGYGIMDETKSTSGNVVTYTGQQKILAFRETVETVLFGLNPASDLGGAWIEAAHELIEPVEAFPVFLSNVEYTFRNPDRFSTILAQT